MKLNEFHAVSSYYADMLQKVREQILDSIRGLVESMGGTISTRYYHEYHTNRYTFFDVNGDGYGVELFVDKVETNGDDLLITLTDSEDAYDYEWELSDFNASNAEYLLQDLEEIAEYVSKSGEDVVAEYPED